MSAITLRPITALDLPFLRKVYASTRSAEMSVVPWSEEQKEAFVEMQFHAQHTHYQAHFAGADFHIILAGNQPIGRFYVCRKANEIRVMDIALLPEHCGQGIGSRLLREVLDEGRRTNKPVRICVEKFNPAVRLYERLGFRVIDEAAIYNQMEWLPQEISRRDHSLVTPLNQ